MGFYEEIASNKRRTYFLIFIFILLIIAVAAVFGYFYGGADYGIIYSIMIGIFAFTLSLILSLISYYHGDKIALKISRARPLKKDEFPYYWHIVEALSIGAGIPKPNPYVIEDDNINAFATGRGPEHSSIAVTTGALRKLDRQELEGVIAHELSHIKNYDIRVMMISAVLVGVVVMLSDFFIRSLWFGGGGDREKGGGLQVILLLIGIVLAILAPLFAQLIKLAISRKREYLADASGAHLTRYPKGLADALKKIKEDTKVMQKRPVFANKSTAHMFIANPFKKGLWANLLSTHPPIEERISRLEVM